MIRRFFLGFVLASAAFAAIAACVGESSSDRPDEGAAGGACFANGTCNAGLFCIAGTCTRGDAAVPQPSATNPGMPPPGAPPPGTPPPGSVWDAACDGAVPPANGDFVECYGDTYCTARAEKCCLSSGAGSCIDNQFNCASGQRTFQCATGSQCADPAPCCLALGSVDTAACPKTGVLLGASCASSPACGAAEYEGCDDEWKCRDDAGCEIIQLTGPNPRVIGICRK